MRQGIIFIVDERKNDEIRILPDRANKHVVIENLMNDPNPTVHLTPEECSDFINALIKIRAELVSEVHQEKQPITRPLDQTKVISKK